jgi:hypothetical protein
MDLSRQLRLCAAAALSALIAVSGQANDCISPVELGEKPAMSAYGDYTDFLVAAMEHKAKEEEKRKHQKMCPELYRQAPVLGASAENLDSAVRRSADQPPFDYSRNQSWYNRSTSQSFGLPGLPNSSMAGKTINTSLAGLEDGPLADQLRNILLALQGPLVGFTDGGNAASLAGRQFTDVLLLRERDVLTAFLYDNFGGRLQGIAYSDDGSLVLYLGKEDILFTTGLIQVESCLSSCGEFGLTLNFR